MVGFKRVVHVLSLFGGHEVQALKCIGTEMMVLKCFLHLMKLLYTYTSLTPYLAEATH
jgi:hypothetical protein